MLFRWVNERSSGSKKQRTTMIIAEAEAAARISKGAGALAGALPPVQEMPSGFLSSSEFYTTEFIANEHRKSGKLPKPPICEDEPAPIGNSGGDDISV
jgi:hypothetical protein